MFVPCEFVCCQVEVFVTDRSFVQGSPNDLRVSECDLKTLITKPIGLSNQEKEIQGYRKRWTGFETAIT